MLEVATSFYGHKPRLSSRFAWATGVEALSKAFAGVPHIDDFKVWFSERPLEKEWTTTMERVADAQCPYQILTVWYSFGIGEPSWYFMVYPVERIRKRVVRELLENEGFLRIRIWLCTPRAETEWSMHHHYRCVFDPKTDSISMEHETSKATK